MSDLIERQAAIDTLGEEPEVWSGNDVYEQGLNNQWHYDVNALKVLPSVDAIPIEWARHWAMKNWVKSKNCEYDIIVSKMIDDWLAEQIKNGENERN